MSEIKVQSFHDGIHYCESYQIKSAGSSLRTSATVRQRIMEFDCRHFLGVAIHSTEADVMVSVVIRRTKRTIMEFLVQAKQSHSTLGENILVEDCGVVDVYVTPCQQQCTDIYVTVHFTEFKNGLEKATSLARNKDDSNRTLALDRSYGQEIRADVPLCGPYQSLDEE